jgi:hypothetical protein
MLLLRNLYTVEDNDGRTQKETPGVQRAFEKFAGISLTLRIRRSGYRKSKNKSERLVFGTSRRGRRN